MNYEFQGWPKIGRLNRDIVITEKIDGTNAAIGIVEEIRDTGRQHDDGTGIYEVYTNIYAQSRTRIITPQDDNYGFARWVEQNREVLIRTLGPGLHFGEWWGVGIGRKYDLSERRFSLFNTKKWGEGDGALALANARLNGVAIYSVPVLYSGPWTGVFGYVDGPMTEVAKAVGDGPVWLDPDAQEDWPEIAGQPNPRPRFAPNFIVEFLKRVGSQAAPGFMKPEGIVVYHRAGDVCFKVTIEKDEQWKGQPA